MDILYPKLFVFAVSVDILCAYRTPAAPAIAAEMVNAISLYFVMLIPIEWREKLNDWRKKHFSFGKKAKEVE